MILKQPDIRLASGKTLHPAWASLARPGWVELGEPDGSSAFIPVERVEVILTAAPALNNAPDSTTP